MRRRPQRGYLGLGDRLSRLGSALWNLDDAGERFAAEVANALRDAHLDFPVFLTVPNSGDSLATMACPLDPYDEDWSHASAIVCRIIGQRLGDAQLCGRALHCAVANATIGAAEVMGEAPSE
jgi:hypothetical protein